MAEHGVDPLAVLLFGSQGRTLLNLKLLRGDASDVSEQDLRDEVHSALLQVQMKTADTHSRFPASADRTSVDVCELEKAL